MFIFTSFLDRFRTKNQPGHSTMRWDPLKQLLITLLTILLTLALSACAIPQVELPAPSIKPTSTPTELPPTSTPQPSYTPRPSATPLLDPAALNADLVWFTPNFGSRDFLELFTEPEEWREARAQIDIFKFYTQTILNDPCTLCGENTFDKFVEVEAFQQLTDWGIPVAIEVGAVKPWGCDGVREFEVADEAIRAVEGQGGTVLFLAMDLPYLGGSRSDGARTCGLPLDETLDATALFVKQVRETYPEIYVGDIEPYPHLSMPEIQDWIRELEARGVELDYFHLDIDFRRVMDEGADVRGDLRLMKNFLDERGIPLGVIFTSNSNWKPASDWAYYQATIAWIEVVDGAIGKPQQMIFQSWLGPAASGAHEVPLNLPENDPEAFSHTRLLLEGLRILER